MSNFMTKNFYKQREDFEKSAAVRDKKFSFPDGVVESRDIPYIADGQKEHLMDVYRPEGKENETLPVIINIHGGGLLIGNKEFNRYFCARLCLLGYVVFSVEYRLIPDCTVYDQFSDVSTAMTFIHDNLSSYQGNPDKIYGVADSGGAYLLTNVAAMTKNKKFAKAAHTKAPDFSLNALGLISGMFYTTRFDKIGLFLPSYLYGKGYKKKAIAPYVNIENPEIVSALPPCFLVTSHSDNLEHYTVKFEKALKANRVSHKMLRFGKNKKLTHAFSVFEPFYEESTKTLKSMHEYFQSF